MTQDARFEDGGERPLNLGALDADDLKVVSALAQDAVLTAADIVYERTPRRLVLLVNRFRWEDRAGDRAERVRSLLVIEDVSTVRSQGIAPGDADTVLSLLQITWDAGDDGAGTLELTFSGDGVVSVAVGCVDVRLRDVTRPYFAPSGAKPSHNTDDA